MTFDVTITPDPEVNCTNCDASCCRLEVMLISDTGVPENFIEEDKWCGSRMARLEDGWCSALDRNTMICREFEMGEYECISERAANL